MAGNTWFPLLKRTLHTLKSSGNTETNIIRNQLDYISVDKRCRNGIKSLETYPEADIVSDHSLVVKRKYIKLKNYAELLNNEIEKTCHSLQQTIH